MIEVSDLRGGGGSFEVDARDESGALLLLVRGRALSGWGGSGTILAEVVDAFQR